MNSIVPATAGARSPPRGLRADVVMRGRDATSKATKGCGHIFMCAPGFGSDFDRRAASKMYVH